ncbi:protein kinase activating protein dpb11 [Sorochytrium milnesiophthora]
MTIALTGVEPSHRPHYQRAIESLGGTYSPQMTKRTSCLIVEVAEGKKFEAACKWGVTMVSPAWLQACVESNDRKEFPPYAIGIGGEVSAAEQSSSRDGNNAQQPPVHDAQETDDASMTVAHPQLLLDLAFGCDGFAKEQESIIQREVERHAGTFVPAPAAGGPKSLQRQYPQISEWMMVVPLETDPKKVKPLWGQKTVVVTEFWLERALDAQGQKYTKALDWGVLIVTREWLYVAARTGKVPNNNDYRPAGTPHQTPSVSCATTPRPSNSGRTSSTAAINETEQSSTASGKAAVPRTKKITTIDDVKMADATVDTSRVQQQEQVDVDPLQADAFLPMFNVDDALHELAMPKSSHSRRSGVGDLAHEFDSYMMAIPDVPGLETAQEQSGMPRNRAPRSILKGVLICLSPKLLSQRSELKSVAVAMGAQCFISYTDTCTHFVHQSTRETETFGDFRRARAKDKHIVSPWWLYQCQKHGTRLPESDFPHTFNPTKMLSLSSRPSTATDSSQLTFDAPDFSAFSSSDALGNNRDGVYPTPSIPSSATLAPESAPVADGSRKRRRLAEDDMVATADDEYADHHYQQPGELSSDAVKYEQLETLSSMLESAVTQAHRPSKSRRLRLGRSVEHMAEATPEPPSLLESPTKSHHGDGDLSKLLDIGYGQDPSCRASEQHAPLPSPQIAQQLAPAQAASPAGVLSDPALVPRRPPSFRSSNSNGSSNISAAMPLAQVSNAKTNSAQSSSVKALSSTRARASVPEPPMFRKPAPTVVRKFLLSAMTSGTKARCAEQIRALGAQVSDSDCWEQGCTHVIIGLPNKSEKFFAAMSAGAWVIKSSYVDAAVAAQAFVDETPHEWGTSPEDQQLVPDTKLLEAPRMWRTWLREHQRRGAFEGWCVCLLVDTARFEGYVRLLKAGGAKVVDEQACLADSAVKLTYVFVNAKPGDTDKLRRAARLVRQSGGACLQAGFIAEYLLNGDGKVSQQHYELLNDKSRAASL